MVEGAVQSSERAGWVRRLYDWVLGWADTRYGALALFILAFVEASFFLIPPESGLETWS